MWLCARRSWYGVTVIQAVHRRFLLFVMGGVQYLILTEHKYRLFCLVLWDLLCTFRWENFTATMRVLSPASVFRGASVLVEMLSLGESLSDYKLGYQLLSSLYYERKEKKKLLLTIHWEFGRCDQITCCPSGWHLAHSLDCWWVLRNRGWSRESLTWG